MGRPRIDQTMGGRFATIAVLTISASMTRRPNHKSDRDKRAPKWPQVRAESGLWLYGLHATRSALSNPKRFVRRAVLTTRAAEEIGQKLLARTKHEITDMH